MRTFRLALATIAICVGLLCALLSAVLLIEFRQCQSFVAGYHGKDRVLFRAACSYTLQPGIESLAIAVALAVITYFLLRSRWRISPLGSQARSMVTS
jgi:hypothetical protein